MFDLDETSSTVHKYPGPGSRNSESILRGTCSHRDFYTFLQLSRVFITSSTFCYYFSLAPYSYYYFSYSFMLRVQIVHSSSIDTCVRIRAATRICVYKFNYIDIIVNVSRKSRKYTGDSPKP